MKRKAMSISITANRFGIPNLNNSCFAPLNFMNSENKIYHINTEIKIKIKITKLKIHLLLEIVLKEKPKP